MKRIVSIWLIITLVYIIVYFSFATFVSLVNGSSFTDQSSYRQVTLWMISISVIPYIAGGLYIRKMKMKQSVLVVIGLVPILAEKMIILLMIEYMDFADAFPYFDLIYVFSSIVSLFYFCNTARIGERSIHPK